MADLKDIWNGFIGSDVKTVVKTETKPATNNNTTYIVIGVVVVVVIILAVIFIPKNKGS